VVDCVIHACQTRFSCSNQIFIGDDLINDLLLGQLSEFVLGIYVFVLPPVELGSTRMAHHVEYELGLLFEFPSSL
jgi:hypothetical protein